MRGTRFSSLSRRDWMRGMLAAGCTGSMPAALRAVDATRRPRIAAIVTEYRSGSHADVIVSRLLRGHILSTMERFRPRTQVVSLYLDQVPEADLGRGMARSHGVQLARSIEEALLQGGTTLAVDGVVLIGEHGAYPFNAKGQQMYPRRRFLEETLRVFQKSGSVVPVFNDKHLGYAWDDAKWMYDQSRQHGFPLMAGSSLPTTWRRPELEYPLDVPLQEGVAIGYGPVEAYGFHALEMLQCMLERRQGGETGVNTVTYVEGDAVWRAAENGRFSRRLVEAAASRLENVPHGRIEQHCQTPRAFLIEYRDGVKGTVLLLDGYATSFAFAGQRRGRVEPEATEFWLQDPEYGHFAFLTHNLETFMLERREVYPVERTVMTTGILDAVMTSRHDQGRRVATPWLSQFRYQSVPQPGRRARFP